MTIRTGNGIIESLLGKVASLVGGVQDLVVEDGKVQGETEADRVSRGELGLGNLGGSLVSLEGLVGRVLAAIANGELGKVAVVVTLPTKVVSISSQHRNRRESLHLVVEDLGLARLGRRDEVGIEDIENVVADLGKLGLDLLAVLLDKADLGRVALGLLLLLDGGDNSPRGTAGTDDVLVGNGQEVALLDGEVTVLGGDDLHVLNHLWKPSHQYNPSCSMGDDHIPS